MTAPRTPHRSHSRPGTTMLVLVIADVHGNRWALEAVLEHASRLELDARINLGDSVYGPLDPGGTADLLLDAGMIDVRGNQDRVLVGHPPDLATDATCAFVQRSLGDVHRAWLAGLSPTAVALDELFLCHGTPSADDRYLVEGVAPDGRVELRPGVEIARELGPVAQPIVLCGHSHVPRSVWAAGKWIINPGSVGLPAYTDDVPHAHAMESGSPHARFALLRRRSRSWQLEHVAIRYDWESAARASEQRDRPDWARWLRTGRQ